MDRDMTMTASTDADSDLSSDEFRHAVGHFATGVPGAPWVGPEGEPVGTTANAVSSLSLDPPLILVCFDQSSLTLEAIHQHGAFVVNVLSAPQQELSANSARRGLSAVWEGVEHPPGPPGSPRIKGSLATLECVVEHSLPGGDHEIIVGRVQYAETSGDGGAPLLFWRGSYLSLEDGD